MPGISRKETLKANAASAYALALQLAQDRKFRNWLISAIYHASAAGKRTRRDLGLRGTVAGLAADETLLKELRSARRDLKQAYGRLEEQEAHPQAAELPATSCACLSGGGAAT